MNLNDYVILLDIASLGRAAARHAADAGMYGSFAMRYACEDRATELTDLLGGFGRAVVPYVPREA